MTPTNVFVLSTGRCGSLTFARACSHATNFTAAHESRMRAVGDERLAYGPGHIEVDNRLSWFLGRLGRAFADETTYYVHLWRSEEATAPSFVKRWGRGVIRAYARGILSGATQEADRYRICIDYCRTVNANIEAFLATRPHAMSIRLRDVHVRFPEFWQRIGAEGDLAAAAAEWRVRHNRS